MCQAHRPRPGHVPAVGMRVCCRASWKLHSVSVSELGSVPKKEWSFPCDSWVETKQRQTLKCGKAVPTGMYTVLVRTGAVRGAGTDANVCIHMFGEETNVGPTLLAKSIRNRVWIYCLLAAKYMRGMLRP